MSRWSDLATWVGPTPNQGAAMREQRGVVVHIAEGYYAGTIAWQRNDSSNVSSHFIVAKDGRIAQMVDTDVTAWTQSAGNGKWLSVENEGFTPNALTPEQVEANARLLARGHLVYGYPLQIATNPDGKGLGHHSMGCNWPAGAWGHCDCPGDAIIAQKQQILDRAIEIVNGDEMSFDRETAWRFQRYFENADPVVVPATDAEGSEPLYTEANKPKQQWDRIETKLANVTVPAPAPVDPAALKAVLLDPEVLAAIAKAVADEDHKRSAQ